MRNTDTSDKLSSGIFRWWLGIVGLILIAIGSGGALFIAGRAVLMTRQQVMNSRFAPSHWVDLAENDGSARGVKRASVTHRTPLRVAIAPVISPEESLPAYQGFVDYLGNALGRASAVLYRRSYAETNDLVRHGWCDLAFVCAYPFVRGEREFGMELLVVPVVRGEITYHSLIIVPASSKARTILDLRRTRFASADIFSNSGYLFPIVWLIEHGQDPEEFFGEHFIAGSHDRSVLAVMSGYADGAAVDSLVYEQMAREDQSVRMKTKVILKSPPFGMPPVVVHPKISPVLRRQLLQVLLNIHNDPNGRKVLARLAIDRFVVPDKELYDSVRSAVELWESRP